MWVVRKRSLSPAILPLSTAVCAKRTVRLRYMGPRIVRLKGQGEVDELLRAREVARRVFAPEMRSRDRFKATDKSSHRGLVLRVESQRALVEVYHYRY